MQKCCFVTSKYPILLFIELWEELSLCAPTAALSRRPQSDAASKRDAMEKASTSSAKSAAPSTSKSPKRSRNVTGEDDVATDEELFREFPIGSPVWAMNKGQWHPAKVIKREEGLHPDGRVVPTWKIHYHKWAARWDEFVMGDSLMPKTPETDAKAATENDMAPVLAPQSKTKEKPERDTSAEPKKSGKKTSAGKTAKGAAKSAAKEKSDTPTGKAKREKRKPAAVSEEDEIPRIAAPPPPPPTMMTISCPSKLTHPTVKVPAKRVSRAVSATKTEKSVLAAHAPLLLGGETAPKLDDELEDAEEGDDVAGPSSSAAATPRVSPSSNSTEQKSEVGTTSEHASMSWPPSVEPPQPLAGTQKRMRDHDEYCMMCECYEAYDPSKPEEQSPEEELWWLQYQSSVGLIAELPSDVTGLAKTPEEKEKECMEALRKLDYINYAKRQKELDITDLHVTLPECLKGLMADNYIQTVYNAKVLKPAKPEVSMEAILKAYRTHCDANPRSDKSVYWNRARLAEIAVFEKPDVFDVFSASFLLRHEIPQREEWRRAAKKDKVPELFRKYGFLHLARYIQRMCFHHNMESKRPVGRVGQQLVAIYDDMLSFLDSEYAQTMNDTERDNLYQDMDAAYIAKIKFVTFGEVLVRPGSRFTKPVVYPFRRLPQSFFEGLLAKEPTGPECLKTKYSLNKDDAAVSAEADAT
ncbi:hypothetical protein BV898_07203 [Hypsibius exemplaris]|uniref:Uncharacterized protein n=1 Tax=Hypsibius exemplaris TaxID=2072580 RepID=A0A1W0WU93_HYPEX|nr:hypothetical protein BV898_07203 [Hypsibius exemplaris]